MKSLKLLVISLILTVLTACTPMIYGVSQERWNLMSEQERIVAMETYKQRQIAYQQAATERAYIRAEQQTLQQAQFDAEMRLRQDRADQIHRGRAGEFGDLIEVSLYNGQMRLNGRNRGYTPVTFNIAKGEIKAIPIVDRQGYKTDLYVLYENRHLWLDISVTGKNNSSRYGHLAFSNDWANGATYTGINSHNNLQLRNLSVDVNIIPIHNRNRIRHRRHQPTVIIKEKVVQAPPQVIIKERIVQAPPQIIIKEKVVYKPQKVVNKGKEPEVQDSDKRHDRVRVKNGMKGRSKEIKVAKVNKVHVELNGGKVMINGKHRPFKPVNFSISEGESRSVKIVGKNNIERNLTVSYLNGRLYFDGQPEDSDTWSLKVDKSKTTKVKTKGALSLKNVQVKIIKDK